MAVQSSLIHHGESGTLGLGFEEGKVNACWNDCGAFMAGFSFDKGLMGG